MVLPAPPGDGFRFREEGIAIPFPQRDIQLYRGLKQQKQFMNELVGGRPVSKSA
jgi:small-conductance mechanosensitive channel